MDVAQIHQILQRDAVTVVFINVLLQQVGLPVPAPLCGPGWLWASAG